MGEFINTMFEKQYAYLVYDNGLGNLLGRDIIFIMLGFDLAVILILFIEMAKELEKKAIKKFKRWKNRRKERKDGCRR